MVFITGSSGLVGSHLIYALAVKGEMVRALYRSKESIKNVQSLFAYYNKVNNTSYSTDFIEWVEGDILDTTSLDLAMKGIKTVFHCAATVTFLKADFHTCIKVNRIGTANVVNACLTNKIEKLCYVSSTAAIGTAKGLITEETKWTPGRLVSGYSVSKYSAEKEVFRGAAEGLKVSIVNPCLILGPGNWNQSSLTLLQAALKAPPFFTSGTNAIVDARDVANFLILLSESDESEEKYLLIGENISFQELFTKLSIQLNVRKPRYKMNPIVAKLAAFILEHVIGFFGKKSPVSIESMQSAYKQLSYSNKKARERFDYTFYSIDESIKNAINGRFDV